MHLTQHWTGRWKTRERPIRQTSRGKPPKQNTIDEPQLWPPAVRVQIFLQVLPTLTGRCRVGADRSFEAHKVCFQTHSCSF